MDFVRCQSDNLMKKKPSDATDGPPFSFQSVDKPEADIPKGAFKVGTHSKEGKPMYVGKLEETNPKAALFGVWTKDHGLRYSKSEESNIETKDSCKILCVQSEWEWQDTSNGFVKFVKGNRFTPLELGLDEKGIPIYLGRRAKSGGQDEIGAVRISVERDRYVCYIIPEDGVKVDKCEDFQMLCYVKS